MIRLPSVLAAVVVLLVMAGCTPETQLPQPSGPASGAANTTPSDRKPDAVVIAADGIQVVAEDGSMLGRFGWQDPATSSVATLTAAFGVAPTTTVFGASEPLPRTEYSWGGFVLQVDAFTDQSDLNAATLVHAHVARVGAIDVRIANGLSVGSTRSEALAAAPDQSSTATALNFEPVDLGDGALNFVTATLTGDSVSSIDAPIHNYGY